MSSHKSATRRRLGLLAGSSLAVAALAFAGAALTPATAAAQTVTCVTPPAPASGNGSDSVVYGAGTHNPAITCVYDGTGGVVSTTGAITVSSAAPGGGINLSATGASTITWNSAAGGVTGGAQTNGPIIEAVSESGAINITTVGLNRSGSTVTTGIRADSTAGGAINIAHTFTGTAIEGSPVGASAIEATTTGGAISISTNEARGRTHGVFAQTSGTGTVNITLGSGSNTSARGEASGITAVTGSGDITITAGGGFILSSAVDGKAIVAATSGTATLNVNTGTVGNISQGQPAGGGEIDFSGVNGGAVVNFAGAGSGNGRWLATGASVFGAGADTITLGGTGDNRLGEGGSIAFGGGADTFTVSALASFQANGGNLLDFGDGDDSFNVHGQFLALGTQIDFGAGADTFAMSGLLIADSTVAIDGLETFNNSGLILMGVMETRGSTPVIVFDFTRSNGLAEDVLSMPGATFTGSGASRIVMDVILGLGGQGACQAVRGFADCLDLRGGSTAGTTMLTVKDVSPLALQGGYDPVGLTLVDVAGAGSSAADHFTLDPASDAYVDDPAYGGVIARPGLFVYSLQYDPDNQRHVLVSLPRSEVLEYVVLGPAAQSIWHMTTQAVTDRQTDLRSGADGEVWLRASGEYTKRDLSGSFESFGGTAEFDHSYKLYAGTVMGGMDLISGRSGDYDYVLGGQLGYVSSSLELEASPASGRFTGATTGLYASAWSERFFLDGAFNANFLTLDYESPGLSSKTTTWLNSIGAQLEGGARFTMGEAMFIEPLATAAFVRTNFEEISLAGGEVSPDDAQSRRAALGLRVGGDLRGAPIKVSYYVTGRAWNEFEGSSGGVVNNSGRDLPFTDEFSGGFGEAQAGVNLYNEAGTFSGFLTSGVKFKDGYDAVNVALGLRMRW